MANYRSPKLLRYAKDAPACMCCGRSNSGDVVMAHANWAEYGKGMSIKAHDWAIAAMCGRCHSELDQGSKMDKAERMDTWRRAHVKTLTWLFETGRLTVV